MRLDVWRQKSRRIALVAIFCALPATLAPLALADEPVAADASNVWAAPVMRFTDGLVFPSDRATALAIMESGPPIMKDQAVSNRPIFAADLPDDNSVYAIPPPPKEDEGVNAGGAHLDMDFAYSNRYVYRGVDHSTVARRGNALNLLVEGKLSFDLGAYPHPFVGLLTNLEDNDPVSRFQEIRPYIGATWNLRPFLLEGGHVSYLYPQRESFDTAEAYGKITLDDSLLLHSNEPLLSPYVQASYDYYRGSGWYFEAGIKHDFVFDNLGLVLTLQSDLAYISHLQQLFVFINNNPNSGWQHAEVGLTATYSLNSLLNTSKRFGEFDLKGYVFYDDKLSQNITANNVVWAGTGIAFRY